MQVPNKKDETASCKLVATNRHLMQLESLEFGQVVATAHNMYNI